MIKVDGISKQFGKVKAVDSISFEVQPGENLILLGTSGCGKTTTLKMINRLIDPTGGNIYINNQNIFDQQPEVLRRSIGYVLQNNGLFPHYTVAENIAIVPQLLKWEKKKTENKFVKISFKNMDSKLKLFMLISFIFSVGNSSDVFLLLQAKKETQVFFIMINKLCLKSTSLKSSMKRKIIRT